MNDRDDEIGEDTLGRGTMGHQQTIDHNHQMNMDGTIPIMSNDHNTQTPPPPRTVDMQQLQQAQQTDPNVSKRSRGGEAVIGEREPAEEEDDEPKSKQAKKSSSSKGSRRWTPEEVGALTRGVEKFGKGQWAIIKSSDAFGPQLANRSAYEMCDKWRNMNRSDYWKKRRMQSGTWTNEETKALRLGVKKYGNGNWVAIKNDPEVGPILEKRSTSDISDKWRHRTRSKKRTSKNALLVDNEDGAEKNDETLNKPNPLIDDLVALSQPREHEQQQQQQQLHEQMNQDNIEGSMNYRGYEHDGSKSNGNVEMNPLDGMYGPYRGESNTIIEETNATYEEEMLHTNNAHHQYNPHSHEDQQHHEHEQEQQQQQDLDRVAYRVAATVENMKDVTGAQIYPYDTVMNWSHQRKIEMHNNCLVQVPNVEQLQTFEYNKEKELMELKPAETCSLASTCGYIPTQNKKSGSLADHLLCCNGMPLPRKRNYAAIFQKVTVDSLKQVAPTLKPVLFTGKTNKTGTVIPYCYSLNRVSKATKSPLIMVAYNNTVPMQRYHCIRRGCNYTHKGSVIWNHCMTQNGGCVKDPELRKLMIQKSIEQ